MRKLNIVDLTTATSKYTSEYLDLLVKLLEDGNLEDEDWCLLFEKFKECYLDCVVFYDNFEEKPSKGFLNERHFTYITHSFDKLEEIYTEKKKKNQ